MGILLIVTIIELGEAGGSLVLKLLDIVIIQMLKCSKLQFAYQESVSSIACSWEVKVVIEHFNSRGTPVFGAAMDMSKAFDMVDWSELFNTLIDRKVGCLYLRQILFIYENQSCNVNWCDTKCGEFTVSNGVRQSAVSSAFLFSVYCYSSWLIQSCHIYGTLFGKNRKP